MTASESPHGTPAISDEPRPWPFSPAELTAGLRRHTGDHSLKITGLQDITIPQWRPAVGHIRGVRATCERTAGEQYFDLVVKEPLGSSRAGIAGAGLREVSVYRTLASHLPVRIPQLVASHPKGDWLVLSQTPSGRPPERWQAADYLLATEQLVALHDRFWGLGEDLATYTWLTRPLDSNFDIHVQSLDASLDKLSSTNPANKLTKDDSFEVMLKQIISQAHTIKVNLEQIPFTLLHGDFWPGNMQIHPDGSLVIYDWADAAIGPAIFDILAFTQSIQWWFDPLPISSEEIIAHYRSRLSQTNGFTWEEDAWEAQWEFTLLWTFATGWAARLVNMPNAVLDARLPQLESMLLKPVRRAVARRLSERG